MRRFTAVLVLGALLLALAGCGGGGSSSGSSSAGTTASGDEAEGAKDAVATATGTVEAEWQVPQGDQNKIGYELLKAREGGRRRSRWRPSASCLTRS